MLDLESCKEHLSKETVSIDEKTWENEKNFKYFAQGRTDWYISLWGKNRGW